MEPETIVVKHQNITLKVERNQQFVNWSQILELSKSHPLFHPLSPVLSPLVPSFSKICEVMKCWNSAFNAQGSKVIIVVVQVGAVKIYVAAVQGLRKKETQDETQFTTKLVEKLLWVPIISFCKIFIPSYVFDALLCRNWPFSPPNHLTIWITLLYIELNFRHG
jgi:hypothetical protein